MKNRAASLIIILALILSMLTSLPIASAEEQFFSEDPFVGVEELPTDTPEPLFTDTPEPETEPPASNVPVTDAPTADLPPQGPGAPAQTAEPSVGATPNVTEPPTVPTPAIPEAVASFAPEVTETPEPMEREEITQETDLTSVMAVGSNGIQYAGIHYLSVAAFQQLSPSNQIAYIQAANDIAAMLEAGIVIDDAVFALDEDGTLYVAYTLPTKQMFEGVVVPTPMPKIILPGMQPAVNSGAQAASPEEDSQDDAQIVSEENMELFDSMDVPVKYIAGSTKPYASILAPAAASSEASKLQSLFEGNESFFYKQLSSQAQNFFNAGYNAIVRGSSTGFTTTINYAFNMSYASDAMSALLNTYPQNFDWCDVNGGFRYSAMTNSAGVTTIKVTIDQSKHYNATLEQQAKAKVTAVVNEAKAYAEKNYPSNISYGMIRYFDEWLCENNYYSTAGLPYSQKDTETAAYYYCHTSYGTLLKGYGVCESYAKAMDRLLDAAGIPNLYVVGTVANGDHGWNYVQMSNGSYYLLDTTWDDVGNVSSKAYLLSGSSTDTRNNGGPHKPDGMRYYSGRKFSFPTISATAYPAPVNQNFNLVYSDVYLTKGKTQTLKLASSTYDSAAKTWKSSNTSVAKVDSTGKVTAVAPGKAEITVSTSNGLSSKCVVHVYQFSSLTFNDSKKATHTYTYSASSFSPQTLYLTVNHQANSGATAGDICKAAGLKAPTVSCSKPSIATATATLSEDTIALRIIPTSAGDATITVNFDGQSAKLTLKVRREIQSDWFKLAYTSTAYTGGALKPKVSLTGSAPKGVTTSVAYSANKNAGTATVKVTGTGNYKGSVTLNFQITPASISGVSVSAPKATTYNGSAQAPAITVKKGKTALKKGTDYDVKYNGSTAAPTAAGSYTVTIVGKGNYAGTASTVRTFTIKGVSISAVSVSLSASVNYTGKPAVLNVKVLNGKKQFPASDYTLSYRYPDGNVYANAPTERGKYTLIVTPTNGNIAVTSKVKTITKSFTIK